MSVPKDACHKIGCITDLIKGQHLEAYVNVLKVTVLRFYWRQAAERLKTTHRLSKKKNPDYCIV